MKEQRNRAFWVRGRARVVCLAVIAGSAASLGLWGCSGEDETTAAIKQARNTLVSLGSGGSAAPPIAMRESRLQEVVGTLQRASSGASGDNNAILAGVLGEALSAQGDILADRFREVDARMLTALNRADATINLLREQRSLATALEGYDPATDLSTLNEAARQLGEQLSRVRSMLQDNEAGVRALIDEADSVEAAVRPLIDEETRLREEMLLASPGARSGLAERAREVRRQREEASVRAEGLRAEAERYGPRSQEVELQIRQIETQIGSVESTKARLTEKAQAQAQQARAAREQAEQTARLVGELLTGVVTLVREEIQPRASEALAKYAEASSRFGQARSGPSRAVVAALGGTTQLSIASLQREYAESLSRAAALLADAGSITPAVSGGAGFGEAAKAMREEAKAAMQAAGEAYQNASDGLSGSEALSNRLASRAREIRGEPEPPPEEEFSEEPDQQWAPEDGGEEPAAHPDDPDAAPEEPAHETPEEGADPGR